MKNDQNFMNSKNLINLNNVNKYEISYILIKIPSFMIKKGKCIVF